jgi:pimeloyl-ACP methyl ester carboxylesterase
VIPADDDSAENRANHARPPSSSSSKAGHFANIEQPEDFNNALNAFLTAPCPQPAALFV